uniref:adenylate kinase n=1 Tax=Chenopodium quinoa TaxID=63459 RepID=A0A803KLU7_CHEQI
MLSLYSVVSSLQEEEAEAGGPGCGKGTQCSKIVQDFGFTHLSAGELLETEVKSGSETGASTSYIMLRVSCTDSVCKIIIQLGIQPTIVLVFDCSEEEMIRRVLHRNQGRVDDNMDTIRKRLKVYKESTLPVIDYFAKKGKVRKINAERPVEEVFRSVEDVFSELGLVKHKTETGRAYVQTA